MNVSLFIPCYVDQLLPRVGIAVVELLERLGHTVDYPKGQTCCGQPALNAGYAGEAKAVAETMLRCFAKSDAVVVPSGSCAAMVKVFYPDLFKETKHNQAARELAERTWEFSDFLVNKLEATDVGARFPRRVTFHDGCHGLRELGIKQAPRILLQHVRDLELVEMTEAETCCGFGGAFSVKFPLISTAMAEVKCRSIWSTGATAVVSNDPSCLMQIQGLFDREGRPIKCLHLAEVLAAT